ncbi:MAG: 3-dehydroquinate synthase [Pirellulaceae bacterium]|nr:MAG: 3-dehydroquinate synthase [Pirellulaceae bacterium]
MVQEPEAVEVRLAERSYRILIGRGCLAEAARFLEPFGNICHAVVVADGNVAERYARPLAKQLAQRVARVNLVEVPPGEPTKSVAEADRLWNTLLRLDTDRQSWVFAVGGGVVGDLAGFVAATFARGLSLVQVPTTLLAQVDSSVGGKVAVNLPGAKNMVGAFWQPRLVLIDPATLQSLPVREYRAGLAEVIKYGMIADPEFFAYLEAHVPALLAGEPAVLQHIIRRSCQIKAEIVGQDERETSGRRAVLNYGHTFAHALEAISGYDQFLHGEAVAIGMHCAARLAAALGLLDRAVVERQARLIAAIGLPLQAPGYDASAWIQAMRHDKKVSAGKLRFVLPRGVGCVELVDSVPEDSVRAVLTEIA